MVVVWALEASSCSHGHGDSMLVSHVQEGLLEERKIWNLVNLRAFVFLKTFTNYEQWVLKYKTHYSQGCKNFNNIYSLNIIFYLLISHLSLSLSLLPATHLSPVSLLLLFSLDRTKMLTLVWMRINRRWWYVSLFSLCCLNQLRLGFSCLSFRLLGFVRGPIPGLFWYWAKPMWMGGVVLLPLRMEVQLIIFSPLD